MTEDYHRLTETERSVVMALGAVWNLFLTLPRDHPSDNVEFLTIIHAAQEKILSRPGRRQIRELP